MKKYLIMLSVLTIIFLGTSIYLLFSNISYARKMNALNNEVMDLRKKTEDNTKDKKQVLSYYVDLLNKLDDIAIKEKDDLIPSLYKNEYDRYFEVAGLIGDYKRFYSDYAYKNFTNEYKDIDSEIIKAFDKLSLYYSYEGSRLKFNDVSVAEIQNIYDSYKKSVDEINKSFANIPK